MPVPPKRPVKRHKALQKNNLETQEHTRTKTLDDFRQHALTFHRQECFKKSTENLTSIPAA
jgi:hypothetical protein